MRKRMPSYFEPRQGENHPKAKLSDQDVHLVRALHQQGLGYKSIARKFEEVSPSPACVRDIVKGRRR